MQDKDGKAGPPLQKFRVPTSDRLSAILKTDVLDDDTRKQIVNDIMGAPPLMHDECRLPSAMTPCRRISREGSYPTALRDRVSGGNKDLLSVMAQRLKTLEAQLQAYRMELKEKTEKLSCVEASYKEEQAKREEAESIIVDLYDDNEVLEKQVGEMRQFLADYGLQWVGEKKETRSKDKARNLTRQLGTPRAVETESPSSAAASLNLKPFELYEGDYINELPMISRSSSPHVGRTDGATFQNQSPHNEAVTPEKDALSSLPVSIDVLKRHARILSDHVGSKGVVTNGKQGYIKEREVVHIVIYQDGICVNGGLFRPFGWTLCDAVLKDLADGFYPYEFRKRYPDGFPIEIIDQTSVRFAAIPNAAKPGLHVKSLESVRRESGGGPQRESREEFVKRLPATRVTPGGRLVPVQEQIASLIGVRPERPERGALRHVTEAERHVSGGENAVMCANGNNAVLPHRVIGLVAVLVRYPSGENVTLNLSPENTIAELRRELQLAVPSFKAAYDIRLSFPAVTYNDDSKTLKELGLLTNCTLMVQPKRQNMKN